MIDAVSIFTRGGVVLWSYYFIKLKGNPIDRLIKTIFLEERAADSVAYFDPFKIQWKLANELNLIFVVVYQGIHQLLYVDWLLETVKTEFLSHLGGRNGVKLIADYSDFEATFQKIHQKFDEKTLKVSHRSAERSFSETKRNNETGKSKSKGGRGKLKGASNGKVEQQSSENDDEEDGGNKAEPAVAMDEQTILENRQKMIAKMKSNAAKGSKMPNENISGKVENKKATKVDRTWDFNQKVTKKGMDALDFSKNKKVVKEERVDLGTYGALSDPEIESDSDVAIWDEEKLAATLQKVVENSKFENAFNKIFSAIQNVTGNKTLTEEDLTPPLEYFKSALMAKNVAGEIAETIANSVKCSLLGKKSEAFTSVSFTVKCALTQAIQTILSPKKTIDVLRAALEAKAKGLVYSIVFLGVNGVGKSTNLAKVCYFLKTKGNLKVMIAACDTFRSGAVEQLQFHARCLDVFLYERGYGKEAAQVAADALSYAKAKEFDVVLIDTAGRMQGNSPLMRSLGKLVSMNNPDLILFVGEALVGNDGVDQIQKFNQCLIDSTEASNTRTIDGILLTKFDTVDDKVGAALSMVFITGQPIVFIGTGQKYPHLRKLNAKSVVRSLLS